MKYCLVEVWLPVEREWQSIKNFTSDGRAEFNSQERLSFEEANARFIMLTAKRPNLTFRIAQYEDFNEEETDYDYY